MTCNNERIPDELITRIQDAKNIIIVSHKNCDGDSLGSVIALQRSLPSMGKNVFVPAPTEFPQRYDFMRKYSNSWGVIPTQYDTIIAVDCSNMERIEWGDIHPEINDAIIINIDHHEVNENFGHINWVNPAEPAVGTMIYKLLRELSVPVDTYTANALYVAIMTDTGRFSFNNTNSDALKIAGELIEFGADPKALTTEVYFNFSESYLRNIGIALFNSRSFHRGRILFLTLDRAAMRNFSTTPEDSEGIIDFAMAVRNVDVAVLFKELAPNRVRLSFRSRRGIDIVKVAEFFGGGGHPNAAGCTINSNLATAQKSVLENIRKLLGYK